MTCPIISIVQNIQKLGVFLYTHEWATRTMTVTCIIHKIISGNSDYNPINNGCYLNLHIWIVNTSPCIPTVWTATLNWIFTMKIIWVGVTIALRYLVAPRAKQLWVDWIWTPNCLVQCCKRQWIPGFSYHEILKVSIQQIMVWVMSIVLLVW